MSETKVNGSKDAEVEEKPEVKPEEAVEDEHDPHFVPIVYLPEVHVSMLEDNEDEMVKLRCKLYRFDVSLDPPEWKERGTGEIKLLKHTERPSVRVVMRRDKTLKICANHFVGPWMELKPNCGSDRAWVWSVGADYADEETKSELLAARFANADDAKKWFDAFEEAKGYVKIAKPAEFSDAEEDSGAESDSGLSSADKTTEAPPSDDTSKLADELSKVSVAADTTSEKITASGDASSEKTTTQDSSSG